MWLARVLRCTGRATNDRIDRLIDSAVGDAHEVVNRSDRIFAQFVAVVIDDLFKSKPKTACFCIFAQFVAVVIDEGIVFSCDAFGNRNHLFPHDLDAAPVTERALPHGDLPVLFAGYGFAFCLLSPLDTSLPGFAFIVFGRGIFPYYLKIRAFVTFVERKPFFNGLDKDSRQIWFRQQPFDDFGIG